MQRFKEIGFNNKFLLFGSIQRSKESRLETFPFFRTLFSPEQIPIVPISKLLFYNALLLLELQGLRLGPENEPKA